MVDLGRILSNLNSSHSLEVVDRVSETQLQVGENSKLKNLAVKELTYNSHPLEFVSRFRDLQLQMCHNS